MGGAPSVALQGLIERARIDAGTPVAVLARTHESTSGAINLRLILLGRLQVRQEPAQADDAPH